MFYSDYLTLPMIHHEGVFLEPICLSLVRKLLGPHSEHTDRGSVSKYMYYEYVLVYIFTFNVYWINRLILIIRISKTILV